MDKFASVLVDLSLDRRFEYRIPPQLLASIHVGAHVRVPFGGRTVGACVVAIVDKPEFPPEKLKDVEGLDPRLPGIIPPLLKLGEWMAQYYCCAKEQAIRALLPGAVRSGKVKSHSENFVSVTEFSKAEKYLFLHCQKSKPRAAVIQYLLANHDALLSAVKRDTGASDAIINALVKEGVIAKEQRKVDRDPFADAELISSVRHDLNSEQQAALDSVDDMLNKRVPDFVCLLHGVTGSGKTEVYLRAIELVLEQGKEAIVLVPEISLTPQTTQRFRARFGESVSVLHSGLTPGERFDEWTKVHEGRVRIAVGARSALFAPFRKLGLIVVDEEHEGSYKQDEAPRYHARDVAVMRAYQEKAVVVLGSATPSLESYHNALKGKYLLRRLTQRFEGLGMPLVKVVDMREEKAGPSGGHSIFSRELVGAVLNRVEHNEQVILFLNRRGFATHLSCPNCGFIATCPDCSIDYIYHKKRQSLTCHLCGAAHPAPQRCPQCDSPEIRYSGVGTEKVEAAAAGAFPGARIARMDSDTMTHAKAYEQVFKAFRRGEIDILIGTQMIAKGLDFPKVTLVGVINADISLHIPDFRAEERTFQLLTQVAGRAGRGSTPGVVYIQTYTPFNAAIRHAVNHDYESFYKDEIAIREDLLYPPAGHLLALRFTGEDETEVAETARLFAEQIEPMQGPDLILSPPGPSPIERIKKQYRYSLMLRGAVTAKVRARVAELVIRGKRPKGVKVMADIDAINLM